MIILLPVFSYSLKCIIADVFLTVISKYRNVQEIINEAINLCDKAILFIKNYITNMVQQNDPNIPESSREK